MELNQQLNLIHDKLNRSIQTNMSNTKAIQMVQNILKDMAYQMESMDKKHKQTIGMLGALVGALKDLSPELKEEMKKQVQKKKVKSVGPNLFTELDLPF